MRDQAIDGAAAGNQYVFTFETVSSILATDRARRDADYDTPNRTVAYAQIAGDVDSPVRGDQVELDSIDKCKYNLEAIPDGVAICMVLGYRGTE
ncbi:hypothetical protein WR30_04135 [Burkholderia contaminans FFH2055]|uniref:Uncharacterized protein n=1 Tax=Burkholderia contaminans TaxID=488447 RepID=A0A3N8SN33_9BURK|nr:hypothetical protein [Burkholderia contaminans]KKL37354.1 hypothetical protein WR30_04135 [Burkholderia contaminans FFH2055]MEB4634463.1 hypothetical protein [Burkholderia contaminans]MEB4640241.1 hypothetical protein [Burkholderia contaminans]MEB4655233.1 hypothetical protein [Burkholderia contaminans]MEB4662821.1 hypothetical protein [Burkholderia contaminans]